MRASAGLLLLACLATATPTQASGPAADDSAITEDKLIAVIKALSEPGATSLAPDKERELQRKRRLELVLAVDDLLERFPESKFADEACIAKLQALGYLARFNPRYLAHLGEFQEWVKGRKPTGELAAQADMTGIEIFVIGARFEDMPVDRQLQGTFERYEAFLKDHPDSSLTPIVWASLIRNALARDDLDRAQRELRAFGQKFPQNEHYQRAYGEVTLRTRIGHPLEYGFVSGDGATVDSANFKGHVQILHFWASAQPASVKQLDQLVRLKGKFEREGVRIVGVCLDTDLQTMRQTMATHHVDWVQYNNGKGFDNELVVGIGVTELPTVLVADEEQVLRYINPPDLEAAVEKLLGKPAATTATPDTKEKP